jgi:CubicO group peptidase (beta-lactamase class C family)
MTTTQPEINRSSRLLAILNPRTISDSFSMYQPNVSSIAFGMLRRSFLCFLLIFGFNAASGLDAGSLKQAASYSAARRGFSFLVIQDGRTIFENYPNGGSENGRLAIYSGTKGFWCVAAMVAAQEGILDLNERVANTITEWNASPDNADIRVRDLLNFTAGIDPTFSLHGKRIPDRNRYSIHLHAVRAPGKSFMYGPSQLQIFSELLRRKLLARHLTPQEFLTRKVLRPLGIGAVDFREDLEGHPMLASGFRLSAREWAGLGALILDGGAHNLHRIVREEYLEECFRTTHINPMFGMGFWLNREARDFDAREVDVEKMLEIPWQRQDWHETCLCKSAPADMIAAIGSGYQRMFIVPSRHLIIVRQGRDVSNFSDATFLRLIFR